MLASVPDLDLVRGVAAVVSRPRDRAADSFVLHAPLELCARAALLRYVDAESRGAARDRVAAIAAEYAAFAPEAAVPPPVAGLGRDALVARLRVAVAAGDLDGTDAAAAALTDGASPDDLGGALAEFVLPRLAAAAHAPIFFQLLEVTAPLGTSASLLRPLARELARFPEWRIEWLDAPRAGAAGDGGEQCVRLLSGVPGLGVPGSDFIFPLMHQLDTSGLAGAELAPSVAGLDPAVALPLLQRVAAQSMLQEPPANAPYGWTHCLTMAQAALHCARWCRDPSLAVRVAATYVLGFRAAHATAPLELAREPRRCDLPFDEAVEAGRAEAAGAAYHAAEPAHVVGRLATYAATHEDAHLVKYVVACLRAAHLDPDAARLYLAAAASLCAYWASAPSESLGS